MSANELTLDRHLHELRSRAEDVRLRAARGIRAIVAQEARELPPDAFAKLIGALSRHVFELTHAHDSHDRQSGVLIIEALLDVETEEDAAKLNRFATCLRFCLEHSTDTKTLLMTSRALGRLARVGGSITADFVEGQLKLSLDWLANDERVEGRGLAAALVLRELADNVPTMFSQHVGTFLSQLWHAVYDPKPHVREAAVAALAACLRMIGARSTAHAAHWHRAVAAEVLAGVRGLRAGGSSESIEGALCALAELLRHNCDHLHEPRQYAAVCALAREHFNARDRLVRRSLVSLVPRLAEFDRDAFVGGPVSEFLPFALQALRPTNPPDARAHAFEAVGEAALLIGQASIAPYLPELLAACADALPRRPTQKRPYLSEAIVCVGRLCIVAGSAMYGPLSDGLLEGMLHAGLTPQLVEALLALCAHVPALAPRAHGALLHLLALALTGKSSAAWLEEGAPASASASGSRGSLSGLRSPPREGGRLGANGAGAAHAHGFPADERDISAAAAGAQPYVAAGGGLHMPGPFAPPAAARASLSSASLGPTPFSTAPSFARERSCSWPSAWESASLGWAAPASPSMRGAAGAPGGGGGAPCAQSSWVLVQPQLLPAAEALGLAWGACGLSALPRPFADAAASSGVNGARSLSIGGGYGGGRALAAAACDPAELQTRLALRTLGAFPWPTDARHARTGLSFFAAAAARYLEDVRAPVRAEAVVACYWQLARASPRARSRAHELVLRLVAVCVADADAHVRALTLRLLALCLDVELARAKVLRTLLFSLNDEDLDVRVAAVALVARVAPHNPALVMPVLRRVLLQLVTDIGHFGASRQLDGSVRVLGGLLSVAAPLMAPYARSVLDVLRPKLLDPDPAVAAAVLRTVGSLVDVGGVQSAEDVRSLCPPLLAALADYQSSHKRAAALALLSRLVRASAQLQAVLDACPRLLPLLVSLLKVEREPEVRQELLQVVGILGALDPRVQRMSTAAGTIEELPHASGGGGGSGAAGGSGAVGAPEMAANAVARRDEAAGLGLGAAGGLGAWPAADGAAEANPYSQLGPPDMYSKVAVDSLTAILRDPALSPCHLAVVSALVAIFERLRQHALHFVSTVLPLLLNVVRMAEAHVRDAALEQVVAFVRTVGLPVRPFLRPLLSLIDDCWTSCLTQAIALVEALAGALREFARAPLDTLVPKVLDVLHTDATDSRAPTLRALRALRTLGGALDDHTRALVPALTGLAESAAAPLGARAAALRTLAWLSRDISLSEHASRIVHPCNRLLRLGPRELHSDVCRCLCLLASQMGDAFLAFAMAVQLTLSSTGIEHAPYARVVHALVCGTPPPPFAELWAPVAAELAAAAGGGAGGMALAGGAGGGGGYASRAECGCASNISLAAELANATALGISELGGGGGGEADIGGTPAPERPQWGPLPRLQVNELSLQSVWQTTERSTAEDWSEWMRRLSVELLRESPSPALRACAPVASVYPPLARSVFNCGFVSCWAELHGEYRASLVESLEVALSAERMPHDVLQLLLGLAEFMEHDDRQLPISVHRLADLAMRCHAYAQALHYKELEFEASAPGSQETVEAVEALIAINNQLQQPEAARGVIAHAQRYHELRLDDGWHERLQRWDDALGVYDRRLSKEPSSAEALVGRARCLHALGDWAALLQLGANEWPRASDGLRAELAPYTTAAAWHANDMEAMREYVAALGTGGGVGGGGGDGLTSQTVTAGASAGRTNRMSSSSGGAMAGGGGGGGAGVSGALGGASGEASFFRAVLAVRLQDHATAAAEIRSARLQLDPALTSLIGESYTRAFRAVVRAQQLAELEEISHAQQQMASALSDAAAGGHAVVTGSGGSTQQGPLAHLARLWSARLSLCQRDVEAWQQLLAVRRMVLPPRADARTWLKLASLARKNRMLGLSQQVLTSLIGPLNGAGGRPGAEAPAEAPLGAAGSAAGAPSQAGELCGLPRALLLPPVSGADEVDALVRYAAAKHMRSAGESERAHAVLSELARTLDADGAHPKLASRCWRKVGEWLSEGLVGAGSSELAVSEGIVYLQRATALDPTSYKAWHRWAMLNFQCAEIDHRTQQRTAGRHSTMRFSVGQSLDDSFSSARRGAASKDAAAPPSLLNRFPRLAFGTASQSVGASPIAEGRECGSSSLSLFAMGDETDDAPGADSNAPSNGASPRMARRARGGSMSRGAPLLPRAAAGTEAGEGATKEGGGTTTDSDAPHAPGASAPSAAGKGTSTAAGGEPSEAHSRRERLSPFVVPAIEAFFRSISLGGHESLQDLLRLLTLWFRHGGHAEVIGALEHGFESVPVGTWLAVIPQVIARLDTDETEVRRLVQQLLSRIALEHPQAFIYPLTVASYDAQSLPRKMTAQTVLAAMRHRFDTLVEHARLVSSELMRVAILLPELWVEAIEEASRRYFGQHAPAAMIAALRPVHELMRQGPQTGREVQFFHEFALELDEAAGWCTRYEKLVADLPPNEPPPRAAERCMEQAWEAYYCVLQRISKQLAQLHSLDLAHVSPALHAARDLVLAVPGTYKAGLPVVCIRAFHAELTVISSKQRPRKLEVYGDDGRSYSFLLKGHEDLRQDERVMQLIGLVNQLLATDRSAALRPSAPSLAIAQYAVVPLSPNSGLIGWVVHCDTLHALIREYREARKILLNIEHRLMLQLAPNYELCTLMQKVETFTHALESTNGQDLQRVLWLKSSSSEAWLDRRSTYTRSLAVMSMVGYVLGLGDRHPSNLMLHRVTGAVLHIDFGDCFEVAMQRDKYPERIPFRLTRMLTSAMEVGAIDGHFRATCVGAMSVLRRHKDSVMAMLEAFVHDPLVNWRLVSDVADAAQRSPTEEEAKAAVVARMSASFLESASPNAELKALEEEEEDAEESDEGQPQPTSTSVSNSLPIAPRVATSDARRAHAMQALDPHGDPLASVALSSSVVSASRRHNPPTAVEQQPERIAAKAIAVMRRVHSKLTGRDFAPVAETATSQPLDVGTQVDRLIEAATSKENLCQCYIGWCPFW